MFVYYRIVCVVVDAAWTLVVPETVDVGTSGAPRVFTMPMQSGADTASIETRGLPKMCHMPEV